jgi:hypothetical protein
MVARVNAKNNRQVAAALDRLCAAVLVRVLKLQIRPIPDINSQQ